MRALLKSLSWRGIALTCTALVVLWRTGSWEGAIAIGVVDSLFKIGLYIGHEKIWDRLSPPKCEGNASFNGIELSYDTEARAGYIGLMSGQPVAESVPAGHAVVDLDVCGQVVGLEVLPVCAEPHFFDRGDGEDFELSY